MKPSSFAGLLALGSLSFGPLGCPIHAHLYDPVEATGTTSGAGGADGGAGGTGTSGTGGAGGAGGTGGACAPASIAACYDGPTGTEAHGLCQVGSKTCNAEGTAYGPCLGAVLPTPEDCATATDEDCDGLAPGCKGTALWSKRAGDATRQIGHDVAVDGIGNVLVTGYFYGAMDFGGCPLSNAVGPGLFVTKLDPAGKCLWGKSAGDGANQSGVSVAVDGEGNVLVIGSFGGAMDLAGCTLSNVGGSDLFVAKLDPSGKCLWGKSAGSVTAETYLGSVAADSAGNVLVTGSFTGAMTLAGCSLSNAGGAELFIAKLDPSGNCLWGKSAGVTGSEYGHGVAVDSADNVLVSGNFAGVMDLGGCALSSAGLESFVAKLDPSGNCLWGKNGGDTTTLVGSVAVDGAGNIFVIGNFKGGMALGGCPMLGAAGSDQFIAKLDPSGKCLWSAGASAIGDLQQGGAIAADNAGNVLLVGGFSGSVDFGGGPFVSAGDKDIFLVKLDAAGGHLWSRRAGSPLKDYANSVAIDSAGNILVTGGFIGTADLGTGPLVSGGGTDVFVAKFSQ